MQAIVTQLILSLPVLLSMIPVAHAQTREQAFLSDYSRLAAAPDNPFDKIYVSPRASQLAAKYTAVMIDQPELFLDPGSPYKGIKPDELKAVADALRYKVAVELRSGYQIVD